MRDVSRVAEATKLGAGVDPFDVVRWRALTRVEKYYGKVSKDTLYEVLEREGNLLMYGGASALWHRLTGGSTVVAFDNTNAHIGVGDSSAAVAPTQNDLQAAANKMRKAMDASYPQHTDGTASGNASIVFRSTFGTGDANFAWNEWAIFNASAGGRMLNRKVESLGTKTAAGVWVITITLSLS